MTAARTGLRTGELIVAECFGPTIQGEGPSAGRHAVFVRLSRCNLSCSWCDTPYTWDWSRFDPAASAERRSAVEVADWARSLRPSMVVITGGEPLLQQRVLSELVTELLASGIDVEFETNGTVAPIPELKLPGVRFNVSPKLANSGLPAKQRIVPGALTALAGSGQAIFKFVAASPAELDEIAVLVEEFQLPEVWVMPQGTTELEILAGLRTLAQPVADRGWHLSNRLHVLIWGDERGH